MGMTTSEGTQRLYAELSRAGANPPSDFPARFEAAVTRELGSVSAIAEWGQPLPPTPSARSMDADVEALHAKVRLSMPVSVVPGDEVVAFLLREVGVDPTTPAARRAIASSHRQVLNQLRALVEAAYRKDNPLQDQALVRRLLAAPAVRREVDQTLDREANRVQRGYSEWKPGDRFGSVSPYHQEAHAVAQTQDGFSLRVLVEALIPLTLEP